ncbi:MAG: Xaa-Pro dipeptidase [Gammaproteobacteria bacterium]|nr:Xaa-Pro dipeptidase [Gammaproteobacteria bacterium]
MTEHESADAYYPEHLTTMIGRITDALAAAGYDGVLIAAGSQRTAFLDDMPYPFKVNPHFKALAPITDVPDSFILVKPDETPRLFYHQPQDYWHLPPADPAGDWTRQWDITAIAATSDMHNLLGDTGSLAFIGEEEDFATSMGFGAVNPEPLLTRLHFDRAYKTQYERLCIRAANTRAVRGHRAAEAAFRRGDSEFAIQHAYLVATGEREQQTPYSNIVALNEHCAVLHYQYYDLESPAQHRSMLIDAGAGYRGYAADVTRTYASGDGIFSELIARMDEEQRGIVDSIQPGMNYADLHGQAHRRVANVLVDFELTTLSPDALVETGATSTFLPHGLGHLIGLQTHDVAGFQQDREGSTRAAPEHYPALRLTPADRGEPGVHHRTRSLFHSDVARRTSPITSQRRLPLGPHRCTASLRRHPHRRQRGHRGRSRDQSHTRGFRR